MNPLLGEYSEYTGAERVPPAPWSEGNCSLMGTNRCYYDGVDAGMVARIKKFRIGKRASVVLLLILALLVGLVLYGISNLNPIMISMSEAKARQLAVGAINMAVSEVMGNDIGYDDLVRVAVDAEGRVTMIQANTLLMNELASQAALVAQRNLQLLEDEGVELPLGSALGIGLFSGMGPKIKVSVVPVGSVTTKFVTAFESAGINQTRHEISLEASTLMRIVIPTGANAVQVSASVPVAESIIVGQVPDTYLNMPAGEGRINLIP